MTKRIEVLQLRLYRRSHVETGRGRRSKKGRTRTHMGQLRIQRYVSCRCLPCGARGLNLTLGSSPWSTSSGKRSPHNLWCGDQGGFHPAGHLGAPLEAGTQTHVALTKGSSFLCDPESHRKRLDVASGRGWRNSCLCPCEESLFHMAHTCHLSWVGNSLPYHISLGTGTSPTFPAP